MIFKSALRKNQHRKSMVTMKAYKINNEETNTKCG
jgi:hypothetical protein